MKICKSKNQNVTIDGINLRQVDKFTYLGCEMRPNGDVRREAGIRIGKAGASFRMLQKVWNANNITQSTKLKLFNSIVVSVLLYGCES